MPIDKNQFEDLRRVANADPEKLRVVVDRLRELKADTISPSVLYRTAREALSADGKTADCFIRQALFQFWPIKRHEVSVQDVLDNIRETLRTEPSWNEQDEGKWSRVESVFGDLLSLGIVSLVASAIDLSYEHVNVFRGARILTDIRPIFNDEATKIEGAVISHALHIQFQNVEGPHEVAIALDHSDVEALVKLGERALKKAETAQSFMRDVGKEPTMIPGRTDDA